MPSWPFFGRQSAIDLYREMHAEAVRCAGDRSRDVVFLHYGIPHSPGIFNGRSGTLSAWPSSETVSYIDNLSLVDRTLGEILAEIDRSGLRSSTNVIVTSDHWWRGAHWAQTKSPNRVPLIIRTGGDGVGGVASEPLLTTCLRGLILSLLQGDVRKNADVVDYLMSSKLAGPIEYVNAVATAKK